MADGDGEMSGAAMGAQLDTTQRRFNFLAALRERNQIRRLCAESLERYREIENEMPDSSKMERYVKVIESRRGADHRAVAKIMGLARKGFALWPMERPLRFRDVVQYIAVTDGLRAHTGPDTNGGDVEFVYDIVTEMIPAHL